ncbi:hypothetical protein F5X96DRAFT_666769 [Biscogniauxia mediterranea]|nr:hypothetical protein F5X96DRAFT_666769 [Biscogniauxia mediterranea]
MACLGSRSNLDSRPRVTASCIQSGSSPTRLIPQLHHWNSKQLIYDSLGTLLPDEIADRLSTFLWEISTEACESLYDFVKKKAAEKLDNDEERQILAQMISVITQDEPSDPKVVLLATTGDKLSSAIIDLKLSQLEKVFINFPSKSDPTVDSFPSYLCILTGSRRHMYYAKDTKPPRLAAGDLEPADLAILLVRGLLTTHREFHPRANPKPREIAFSGRSSSRTTRSRLPGFDPRSGACVPKAFLATEGLKDDLCGNESYCNLTSRWAPRRRIKTLLAIRRGWSGAGSLVLRSAL